MCAVLGFGAVVLALFVFVAVDEKVSTSGFVVAQEEYDLYAPEDGLIQEIRAHDGADVRKDDAILLLDSQQQENWKSQIEAEIKEAQAALQLKQAQCEKIAKLPLPKEFWHTRNEFAEAKQKAAYAEVELRRYRQLLDEKLTSQSDFETRQLACEIAQNELTRASERVDILDRGLEDSIKKEALADLNSAVARLERLQTDMRVCREQLERRIIRAPADGKVTLIIKRHVGERVSKGEDLVHLSAGEACRAKLVVGETHLNRIHSGQRVRLRSNVFEFMRYGYVEAHVEEVALEPYVRQSGEPVREGAYRVMARIDRTPVPLALGSTLEGHIILRHVPIWRLLLPEL